MFERRVKPGLRKISKISMVSLFLWVMMAGILLVTQAFAQTNFTVEPYHPNGKKYAGQSGIGDISGSTILAANTRGNEYSVNIRLDGVTEYELAEIFGKVIDNSAGVLEKHGCILRRAWVREKNAKAQLLHSFNKPPLTPKSVTISKNIIIIA